MSEKNGKKRGGGRVAAGVGGAAAVLALLYFGAGQLGLGPGNGFGLLNDAKPAGETTVEEEQPAVSVAAGIEIRVQGREYNYNNVTYGNAEHSLEENLADLRKLKENYPDKVLIASIMGPTEKDWEELARLVTEAGADMIEMNLSCPQMTSHAMGSDVGTNPELCKKFCQAVKRGSSLPMMAKMTPNITDMVPVAQACLEGGADGIAAINTIKSICNVDLNRKIGLPIINGKSSVSGYSGKAVKPVALRFVQQLRDGIPGVPISGIGGIETWEDAAEFILLGATTLQITTAVMQDGYRIVEDLKNGLEHYMEEQGVDSLMDLVGAANGNMIPAENLDRDYVVYPEFDNDKCIGCGRCYISCFDGAHQAITWDDEKRRPSCDHDKCVGCHLCVLVCPVRAIGKGEIVMKPGRKGSPEEKAV